MSKEKHCTIVLNFNVSYDCRQELELGRDILSRLLDSIEPDIVLAQFRDEIYMGMGHPDESIRELCIKQVWCP